MPRWLGHSFQFTTSRDIKIWCAVLTKYHTINFSKYEPTAIGAFPISFNRNSNLRSLDISSFSLHPSFPCHCSWLQDIVATITSQKLEEMTLWFCTSHKEWVEAFDFESFEHSLIHRVDPPALPTVRIKFVHTDWWPDADHPLLAAAVKRRLSVLDKRGVLVVYPRHVPSEGWWPYSY